MSRQAPEKPQGYLRIADCGFSVRTTSVLIKAGINAPEKLLAMAPQDILLIQGIGSTLMKEIERYRARATGAP
jgi:DNA-directed RNA polymerase alpha subunit